MPRKGQIPWNKGKKTGLIPKTAFKKGSRGFRGRHTQISKEKMSVANKGKRLSPKTEFRKGQVPWNKGIKGVQGGEKHYNWKGGITPINQRIRKSLEYKLWHKAVLERDDYTCRFCGQRGGNLEVDHIKPFAYFPELRFAIDNGRTLCRDCHLKTDTYAGKAIKVVNKNKING